MRRFKFDRPLVESKNPPKNPNVLWVDVNESTGKVANIKKFKKGQWIDYMQFVPEPEIPQPVICPADNEIWYTTTDGSFINFKDVMGINGTSILSDTMSFEQSSQGEYIVARFSENIISIGGILMGDTFYEDGYKLACIALPSSINSTNGAFSTCINLTNVINPPVGLFIDGNSNESCFENTNIKEFVIPINATCIPWACFRKCYSLKSITIPNSITLIKGHAFNSCESLNSINFEGTMEQWDAIEKGENWNLSCPTITVHCTDGDITIPAN